MTKTTISLIFCLLTISLTLEARQVVTGQITNRYDGTPIPNVSVFIAHTTVGTQSDRYGNFSITVPIQGSFVIVVSHIGFQSASRTIDTPRPSHQINFALQEQIELLQEVVVNPCIPHRRRDENFFWRFFLGEIPSSSRMQVLNREVIHFCLLPIGILRVFADEPIEIINHNMGYHISYVLHRFEHNFRTGESLIAGEPFFTELTPRNERQGRGWEIERQNAYLTSLTRFIRALYQERLYENGFLLAKGESMNRLIPLSLTQADSIRMMPFDAVSPATTFPYSLILQRDTEAVRINIEQTFLLGFIPRPITYAMFRAPGSILEAFPFVRLLPANFIIYSDGSYSGILRLNDYRNMVIGLRTRLPMEFRVDESTE